MNRSGKNSFTAYNDALERVLGAPAGSLHLIDPPTLQVWFAEAPVATDPVAQEVPR